MKTILKVFTLLFCVVSFAQTTIKGKITDNSGLPLPGANIVVVGTSSGTVSDFDGNYTLIVDQEPPFSIRVSYTGFKEQTLEITSNNQTVDVTLLEGNELDEVVISASRTPERIFESPVTVERFGLKEIKNNIRHCDGTMFDNDACHILHLLRKCFKHRRISGYWFSSSQDACQV